MSNRQLGLALLALGGILVVIGAVMLVSRGEGATTAETLAATATTSTANPTTTTTTTTTLAPAITTTTSLATTTTTTIAEVTTTSQPLDAQAEIESFFLGHAAAIKASDIDILMNTLHPAVIEVHGEELSRSFIEREILALVDYRLTGGVTGPESQTVAGSTFDVYSAPVAFTFSGEDFDASADFAFENGEVRWLTQCR